MNSDKKYAILITTYNKIETLKYTLASIKQTNIQKFLFIDFNGDKNITNNICCIAKHIIPNINIVIREQRFNPDLNAIFSLNEVFEKGFDGVFYTEDDVIYDDTAIETLINLADYTDNNIPNIGIVQSWNYNIIDPLYANPYYKLHGLQELKYNCSFSENEIGYTGQNFWGCLIKKSCWDKIKNFIINHFICLYNKKTIDVMSIMSTVAEAIKSNASLEVKHRIISRWNYLGWQPQVDLAMLANNLYKICLTNPRSKTIGVTGATSTDNMFYSCGLDKIETLNSKNIPTSFNLNQNSKKLWFAL